MTEFNVAFRMHRDLFVVVDIDNHFGTLTSHPIRQRREPRLARVSSQALGGLWKQLFPNRGLGTVPASSIHQPESN
jgi:hypothetical protein